MGRTRSIASRPHTEDAWLILRQILSQSHTVDSFRDVLNASLSGSFHNPHHFIYWWMFFASRFDDNRVINVLVFLPPHAPPPFFFKFESCGFLFLFQITTNKLPHKEAQMKHGRHKNMYMSSSRVCANLSLSFLNWHALPFGFYKMWKKKEQLKEQ